MSEQFTFRRGRATPHIGGQSPSRLMIYVLYLIIRSVKNYPLDQLIVGCFLSIVGLAIIIFHRAIKERHDDWRSKDFPIGDGEMFMKVNCNSVKIRCK